MRDSHARAHALPCAHAPCKQTHLDGVFRLTVVPAGEAHAGLPAQLLDSLHAPLLATPEGLVVHGFSLPDYLSQLGYTNEACDGSALARLGLGGNTTWHPGGCPFASVGDHARLDDAVADATRGAKRLLRAAGLREDEAHAALSTAVDLGFTQMVDGVVGAHALVPWALLGPAQAQ